MFLKFEPLFIPVFHLKLLKNHQCENSFRIQKIQLTNWVCLLIAFSLNLCLLKFADFLAKQIFDGWYEMLCSLHHKTHECKLYQNEYPINEMNVNLDWIGLGNYINETPGKYIKMLVEFCWYISDTSSLLTNNISVKSKQE